MTLKLNLESSITFLVTLNLAILNILMSRIVSVSSNLKFKVCPAHYSMPLQKLSLEQIAVTSNSPALQKIQFAQNSRPPLLSLEADPVTPRSIRNYMQPLETVVVTLDPFSTPSSLVKTPLTSLGLNLKRRLSFLDQPGNDFSESSKFSHDKLAGFQHDSICSICFRADPNDEAINIHTDNFKNVL